MADDGLRLYGTPDPDMDQTPPEGGMRGEGHAAPDTGAARRHAVTLDDGRRVEVEEQSGLSYAAATGKVMPVAQPATPRETVRAVPLWPLVVAATLGFAIGQRWRRARDEAAWDREPLAAGDPPSYPPPSASQPSSPTVTVSAL